MKLVLMVGLVATTVTLVCVVLTRLGGPSDSYESITPVPPQVDVGFAKPQKLRVPSRQMACQNRLAEIELIEGLDQRNVELDSLVTGIELEQIGEILNSVVRDRPNELMPEFAVLLLRRWVEGNPVAAAAWAEQLPSGPISAQAFEHLGIVWTDSDPSAAVRWAQGLTNGVGKEIVLRAMAGELARTDPLDALRLELQLVPGIERDDLLTRTTEEWAASDPSSAAAWAGQIADSALRDQLLSRITVEWSEHDPVKAATLLLNSTVSGRTQDDAVVGIVERWVQTDPIQAAAWVAQFPESMRGVASQNLVAVWARNNPEAAGTWLNTIEHGPAQDLAIVAYVSALKSHGSPLLLTWAKSISDVPLRQVILAGLEPLSE